MTLNKKYTKINPIATSMIVEPNIVASFGENFAGIILAPPRGVNHLCARSEIGGLTVDFACAILCHVRCEKFFDLDGRT
jgi:hypothetical protein